MRRFFEVVYDEKTGEFTRFIDGVSCTKCYAGSLTDDLEGWMKECNRTEEVTT